MRRLLAGSVAALMLTLGVPLVGTANGTAASIFGQVVNAGGRGTSGVSVELLKNGATLSSTVTGSDGRFTMNGIQPGTYVVRTMVNGRPAGVQVSLSAGQSAPVIVVLPSMVTAAAQAQFASLLANLATTLSATTVATVVSEAAVAAQEASDQNLVEDAVVNGTTLQVLVNALNNPAVTSQLTAAQIQQVASAVIQIAVSLPPSSNDTLVQQVTQIASQNPTITVVTNTGTIQVVTPPPVFSNTPTASITQ